MSELSIDMAEARLDRKHYKYRPWTRTESLLQVNELIVKLDKEIHNPGRFFSNIELKKIKHSGLLNLKDSIERGMSPADAARSAGIQHAQMRSGFFSRTGRLLDLLEVGSYEYTP